MGDPSDGLVKDQLLDECETEHGKDAADGQEHDCRVHAG
jgi:hypothetical protein